MKGPAKLALMVESVNEIGDKVKQDDCRCDLNPIGKTHVIEETKMMLFNKHCECAEATTANDCH
jgi:hypothetical protein